MRAFIVTQDEARRIPGAFLLLIAALYLIPGLLFRDPWGRADAEGLGIALTMARGGLADWLAPNIFGLAFTEEGPLHGWLGALAILALGGILGEQTAARLMIGVIVACGLCWIWLACSTLARRPEVQPADPFEASARPSQFGRAVADAALLVTMATCGLIARVHETTAEALQFSWTAAFLLGAAIAIDRPVRGGLVAGLAIAASALTRGLPTACAMILVLVLLPVAVQRFRLVAWPMLSTALATALLGSIPWPTALLHTLPEGAEWLRAWLGWNASEVGAPTSRSLIFLLRNLPWYLWPTWPLALWAAWAWRKRWQTPAIGLPLLMALSALVLMLLTPSPSESMMQPAAIPFALLAALGLTAARRGLISMLDWTAVATFSLIGFILWAYWVALLTGFPPRMADSALRLAPGFFSSSAALQTVAGIVASAGWLLMVWWRTSRRPRVIWRPMVLSCGGLVLAWFLLIVLWLPVYDARVSYRKVAQEIGKVVGDQHECVRAEPLEPAIRANLAYFGGLRFGKPDQICEWLLSHTDQRFTGRTQESANWTVVWQGRRPFDSTERLTLYRRAP